MRVEPPHSLRKTSAQPVSRSVTERVRAPASESSIPAQSTRARCVDRNAPRPRTSTVTRRWCRRRSLRRSPPPTASDRPRCAPRNFSVTCQFSRRYPPDVRGAPHATAAIAQRHRDGRRPPARPRRGTAASPARRFVRPDRRPCAPSTSDVDCRAAGRPRGTAAARSSAACSAHRRTRKRSPGTRNPRACRTSSASSAIHTVPGSAPPCGSGPRRARQRQTDVGAEHAARPRGHLERARLADHPGPSIVSCETPRTSRFALGRVDDRRTDEVVRRAGTDVSRAADSPAGERLGARERLPGRPEQPPDRLLELLVVHGEHGVAQPVRAPPATSGASNARASSPVAALAVSRTLTSLDGRQVRDARIGRGLEQVAAASRPPATRRGSPERSVRDDDRRAVRRAPRAPGGSSPPSSPPSRSERRAPREIRFAVGELGDQTGRGAAVGCDRAHAFGHVGLSEVA